MRKVALPEHKEREGNMESAWYYEIDGEKIDSEQCCCFRNPSPYCPIHGRDPNAKPLPRKNINLEEVNYDQDA